MSKAVEAEEKNRIE
jgi:hypothetical protein